MKLKTVCISLLVLSLCACFGGDKDQEKEEKTTPQAERPKEQTTLDLNRAALLNVEMGEKYLAQGQITRAKSKFIHALEIKPKLPEAHSSIGYFYETVGEIDEAERHYKNAISYGDKKGKYYNNYGTFLCRQGRYKEADRAFRHAIDDKQYLEIAKAYENAGVCALKQPDVAKATEYLQTALRRDPTRHAVILELANIELNKKHYLVAREYITNYLSAADPNPRALWLNIQVQKQLNDKTAMITAAQKLENLFPDSEEYKLYLESEHG